MSKSKFYVTFIVLGIVFITLEAAELLIPTVVGAVAAFATFLCIVFSIDPILHVWKKLDDDYARPLTDTTVAAMLGATVALCSLYSLTTMLVGIGIGVLVFITQFSAFCAMENQKVSTNDNVDNNDSPPPP